MPHDKAVIAVIPNYNMADSLRELLPALLHQNYTDVFVLDDASTDHSLDVVHDFQPEVTVVAGTENVGAGANRNRILPHLLGREAIVHFIDADMRLETERIPEIAQEVMSRPDVMLTGGLINTLSGQQLAFNFGPRICLANNAQVFLQALIERVDISSPAKAKHLHSAVRQYMREWPDLFEAPQARSTYWVAESNMLVDARAFSALNGFDPSLRYHEIHDLALRMEAKGMERYFDPIISGVHKAIQVRQENLYVAMFKAQGQIIRKHGLKVYLFP